jgi:hypothetical protein
LRWLALSGATRGTFTVAGVGLIAATLAAVVAYRRFIQRPRMALCRASHVSEDLDIFASLERLVRARSPRGTTIVCHGIDPSQPAVVPRGAETEVLRRYLDDVLRVEPNPVKIELLRRADTLDLWIESAFLGLPISLGNLQSVHSVTRFTRVRSRRDRWTSSGQVGHPRTESITIDDPSTSVLRSVSAAVGAAQIVIAVVALGVAIFGSYDWSTVRIVVGVMSVAIACAAANGLILEGAENSPPSASPLLGTCALSLAATLVTTITALAFLKDDDLVLHALFFNLVLALSAWLLAVPADRGLRTGGAIALLALIALLMVHGDGISLTELSARRSTIALSVAMSVPIGIAARRTMLDYQFATMNGLGQRK